MADADLTYDFDEIPRFLATLEEGAEMVMGDRMDNIQPGAMPWLHRYVGNPLLTGLLNLFFRTGVTDAHCGMRALRRDVLERLDLRTTGMEFASEMVIRAAKENLRIAEFPIEYHPRGGECKLSSFRDGWRHLRFLLVHSPNHLFIVPGTRARRARHADRRARRRGRGLLRARVGPAHADRRRAADDRRHAGARARPVRARVRHLLHGRAATPGSTACAHASGSSTVCCWRRVHARRRRLRGRDRGDWISHGFGALAEEQPGGDRRALVIVGIQIFFSSFLLSILGLRRR